ncbi:MAG: ABC transporter permease, partial [Candidatus Thorarchaeota archaeon]
MAAVPVGYEAFQSARRKGVTLLCFVMATAMIMGIAVYVDSYSIYEWENLTDIGPGALYIENIDLVERTDEIRAIPGIERAASISSVSSEIMYTTEDRYDEESGLAWMIDDTFLETFPDYYTIEGRMPANESEIAVQESYADRMDIEIGVYINFTDFSYEWKLVKLVGIYQVGVKWSMVLVSPELIEAPSREFEHAIIADVDRTPVSPFDVSGSSSYLISINSQIYAVDPNYEVTGYSRYYVHNMLWEAVRSFTMWQTSIRYNQIWRASGVVLIVFLVAILAIRYNVKDRRFERSMLLARGASKGDVGRSVTREVFLLSVVSATIGLGVGILFSRLAIATDGFLNYSLERIFAEPLLITIESLFLALIVGLVLPLGALLSFRRVRSTSESIEGGGGRIAKLAKGLKILRWDFMTVLVSIALLYGLGSAGPGIRFIPFIDIIVSAMPLALFLGIASITMKALRKGAFILSKLLK